VIFLNKKSLKHVDRPGQCTNAETQSDDETGTGASCTGGKGTLVGTGTCKATGTFTINGLRDTVGEAEVVGDGVVVGDDEVVGITVFKAAGILTMGLRDDVGAANVVGDEDVVGIAVTVGYCDLVGDCVGPTVPTVPNGPRRTGMLGVLGTATGTRTGTGAFVLDLGVGEICTGTCNGTGTLTINGLRDTVGEYEVVGDGVVVGDEDVVGIAVFKATGILTIGLQEDVGAAIVVGGEVVVGIAVTVGYCDLVGDCVGPTVPTVPNRPTGRSTLGGLGAETGIIFADGTSTGPEATGMIGCDPTDEGDKIGVMGPSKTGGGVGRMHTSACAERNVRFGEPISNVS
jgi:hypothetical protein